MSQEFSSGIKFKEGDEVKGYRVVQAFPPGAFAFAGKAIHPTGRPVFFKKYKRPGGSSPWYEGFVNYQLELKRRIQADAGTRELCYEFVEFFERKKSETLRSFYQVFEWIEDGTDLRGVVNAVDGFGWQNRVIFARVLMAGVHQLHRIGVIHSDLKPENFYLIPAPHIKAGYKLRVIDLDFSVIDGKRAPWHEHPGEGYVGTPAYMSPEHLDQKVPQRASDVFSCGLILSELIGDGHPARERMELYDELAKGGGLSPICVREQIPEVHDMGFLSAVLNGMLRPEPNRRPTAEQVLHALNGRLHGWDGMRPKSSTRVEPDPGAGTGPPVRGGGTLVSRLEIRDASSSGAKPKVVSISTTFGRRQFSDWHPDFGRFFAFEQFRLSRSESGWTIEHCKGAPNQTTLDGAAIEGVVPVTPGALVAVGRNGRCPITLHPT